MKSVYNIANKYNFLVLLMPEYAFLLNKFTFKVFNTLLTDRPLRE